MNRASRITIGACSVVSLLLAVLALLQQALPMDSSAAVDSLVSWEFVAALAFMGITATLLHRTLVHPYVFFLATCAFFLGGRLIVHLLGYEAPLFADRYFGPISLSPREALRLISVTLGCLLALHAGYMMFWIAAAGRAEDRSPPQPTRAESRLFFPALALLVAAATLGAFGMIVQYRTIWGGAYVGLYQSQAEFATRLVPLANYGLILAMGLAVASGHRVLQLLTILALGVFSLSYLGLGVRSAFMAFMLLAVWMVHKELKRLPGALLIALPVVLVVLAQSIWAFSARSDQTEKGLDSKLAEMRKALRVEEFVRFAHVQSVSLLSISVADRTTGYPLPAYGQTFIPGFGLIAAATGQQLGLDDLYFAVHMAKTSLPNNYRRGETMGWSIVSDMLVFSQRNAVAFLLISACVGVGFAFLVSQAAVSRLWFGALALVFPKLMLLPRAGLYSIVPYLEVFFLIAVGWFLLWRAIPAHLASRLDRILDGTEAAAGTAMHEKAAWPRTR